MAEDFDSFAPKNFLQFAGGIFIEIAQQLWTALNDRHFHPKSRKELRELHSDRPAAEYDQRFRWLLYNKRIIAGQIANLVQVGQGRGSDDRAGADDEMRSGESFVSAERERMFIQESGFGANESKAAIRELLPAIIGKFFNKQVFAGHHGPKVEPD